MTGVSSQRSSKFCDEGADGGEEEVGALLPEGNRTTGPFLTAPAEYCFLVTFFPPSSSLQYISILFN